MTDRNPPPVQFRAAATSAVRTALDARAGEITGAGLGATARRDLERYYALLAAELATLDLTEAEAAAVCDAANGTLFDPTSIRLLWAEVADAIRLGGLAAKWGIDGDGLVARLQALTPGQAFALADAVERFWRAADTGDTAAVLRQVGLVAGG